MLVCVSLNPIRDELPDYSDEWRRWEVNTCFLANGSRVSSRHVQFPRRTMLRHSATIAHFANARGVLPGFGR